MTVAGRKAHEDRVDNRDAEVERLRGELTRRKRDAKRLQRKNDRLQSENDRLKQQIEGLKRQLAEARRAGRRQAAPFAKDRPQGRGGRPGRRAGADYGRQGCRPRPTHIDETHAAPVPAACPDCGGAVAMTRVASQYQEELPAVRPVVRRFDVEVGHCSQCQRRVQGRHVLQTSDALGAAGVQLGPGVVALVVELHTELGVPLAKVAHLLRTTFGLHVTPGGLAHLLHRAGRAAAPAYAKLCAQVRNAPVVTPDETGWRVGAVRHWLWAFVTPQTTVYAICSGRGFNEAASAGDRLRRRARARRMGSVSALRRTAPNVSESPVPTLQAAPGGSSRQSLGRRRAGDPAGRPRPARPLPAGAGKRTRDGNRPRPTHRSPGRLVDAPPPLDDAERFAAHLATEFPAVFLFLSDPSLDATNWRAEQAIRPAVVIRKVCGGNRTRPGRRHPCRSSPAWCVARQRNLDLPALIAAMLRAAEPCRPRTARAARRRPRRHASAELTASTRGRYLRRNAATQRVPTKLRPVGHRASPTGRRCCAHAQISHRDITTVGATRANGPAAQSILVEAPELSRPESILSPCSLAIHPVNEYKTPSTAAMCDRARLASTILSIDWIASNPPQFARMTRSNASRLATRLRADVDAEPVELLGEFGGGAVCPLQAADGVAGRLVSHQGFEAGEDFGRFFPSVFVRRPRAAPGRPRHRARRAAGGRWRPWTGRCRGGWRCAGRRPTRT